mgnify:CR=1 FL=1
MFDPNDSLCAAAMKTIKRIAKKHDADPSAIIYAWIMYHPAGAVPISGSNRLDRLDTAIKAWTSVWSTMNGMKYIRPRPAGNQVREGPVGTVWAADTCLNSLLPAVRPHGH